MSKVCSRCGQKKPNSAFKPQRRSADGLAARCKECQGEREEKVDKDVVKLAIRRLIANHQSEFEHICQDIEGGRR